VGLAPRQPPVSFIELCSFNAAKRTSTKDWKKFHEQYPAKELRVLLEQCRALERESLRADSLADIRAAYDQVAKVWGIYTLMRAKPTHVW
jgi:hypothetical protein